MNKNLKSYIPKPYDTQGFLFLKGEDDLDAAVTKGEESIFLHPLMAQVCLAVNTVNLMRKLDLDYVEAKDLADFYSNTLPWVNKTSFETMLAHGAWHQNVEETLEIMLFNPDFFAELAHSELWEREALLERFRELAYGLPSSLGFGTDKDLDETSFLSYYAYLDYATKELSKHWSEVGAGFIAPIFATEPLNADLFGSLTGEIVATSYIKTIPTACFYDWEEANYVLASLGADGEFEALFSLEDGLDPSDEDYWDAVEDFPYWGKAMGTEILEPIYAENLEEELEREYL